MAAKRKKPAKGRGGVKPAPKRKPTPRSARTVAATEHLPPPVPAGAYEPHAEPDGGEPWGEDGLTIRQRQFVAALVGPAAGNATRAAEMAGYASENRNSLTATASRLLTFVKVQEAVAHAHAALRDTPEWARASLVDIAASSLASFLSPGPDGSPVLDFAKAAAAGAIGQIREYREEGISAGGTVSIIKRTVKLHDRRAALETLLKLHGKLIDRHEVRVRPTEIDELLADPHSARLANDLVRRMAGQSGGDGPSAN